MIIKYNNQIPIHQENPCLINYRKDVLFKTVKKFFFANIFFLFWFNYFVLSQDVTGNAGKIVLFPENQAENVNPDTHLKITFSSEPVLGQSGQIGIYDMADGRLVDLLDLSIPPGPTTDHTYPKPPYIKTPYEYVSGNYTNANTKAGTPSGGAFPTPDNYQLTIIGGFTDGFHFYPVIRHNSTATIYLHHNLLEYNKTYYVKIDSGVLKTRDDSFQGINGKDSWVFSTKKSPPAVDSKRLVVSADGSADFNTVQGALDFIPDYNQKHVTVYIKNGIYEEIVYFRNKNNVTILGESREKVIVKYYNREFFNPHPENISTNEVKGTFPSRRAAFAIDNSKNICLVNLTVMTTAKNAQAEGLLINGEENIVSNVSIIGDGDALQSNGSAFYTNCSINGGGDLVLGRGPAFFSNCELYSPGPFMWIRNTDENHGNVFVNCIFDSREGDAVIARKGDKYPHCEAVLINCRLRGIAPVGWGQIWGESSEIHYWEFNSTDLFDDQPVDMSQRHWASRQLTMKKDAGIIAGYSNPEYVLGGWLPVMSPLILSQPSDNLVKKGQMARFCVKVTAIPEPEYQWLKNGIIIKGATNIVLKINNVSEKDEGDYTILVKNEAGNVTSETARLIIE